MGFFSFLFRRPVFVGDVVFGRLRQEDLNKRTGKAWFITEDLVFHPTGHAISCDIDATIDGPSAAQQAFYQHIEQNYNKLTVSLIPIIEEGLRNWEFPYRIQDFAKEFQLRHFHSGNSFPTHTANRMALVVRYHPRRQPHADNIHERRHPLARRAV